MDEEYQHVDISEHVEDVTCVATNVSAVGRYMMNTSTHSVWVDSYMVGLHPEAQTAS